MYFTKEQHKDQIKLIHKISLNQLRESNKLTVEPNGSGDTSLLLLGISYGEDQAGLSQIDLDSLMFDSVLMDEEDINALKEIYQATYNTQPTGPYIIIGGIMPRVK